MIFKRTQLAWKNLTHSGRRLALAIVGIGFAVLLMTMQVGFRNAMLDSTVSAIDNMNADLILVSAARYTLSVSEQFSRRLLTQIASDADVAATYPLYIDTHSGMLENPKTKISHPIRIFAFDPDDQVLLLPEVAQRQQALKSANTVLFDQKSKSDFGAIAPGSSTKLSGHAVNVDGVFTLGTDFANDGNLVMSSATLSKLFRKPARFSSVFRQPGAMSAGLNQVDVGLIKLKPGIDPTAAQSHLKADLPDDVVLLTKHQFQEQERNFWEQSTPVGIIFGLGTAMGFLVGIIFCYQILYNDIADHLPEFATLRAMGYPGRYFVGLVMQEALLLALFGFVPGVAVSAILYWWLGRETGLMLDLTPLRCLQILALTIGMCAASAALTVRKVLSTDPAELL